MTHYGLISPATAGHLNPMCALGQELQHLGHRVSFIAPLDARAAIEDSEISYVPFAESEFPAGTVQNFAERIAGLRPLAAGRHTFAMLARSSAVLLEHAPEIVRRIGCEALVVDALERAAPSVAERLDLPFFTVCSVLPSRPDADVPPFITHWRYRDSTLHRLRNRAAYAAIGIAMSENLRTINRFRRRWQLTPMTDPRDSWSPHAVLCQLPRALDFPRRSLPAHFHYVGPMFRRPTRTSPPFPFEKLDDRPLVYATLGTLLGHDPTIFPIIAAACEGLALQLVISWGQRDDGARPQLPGSPLCVDFAPQRALLSRAALTIAHAGINTTLESLAAGVPLLALPICNDQPGVAARIAWTRSGDVLRPRQLRIDTLRKAIRRILDDPSYRNHAHKLRHAIDASGGASLAATLIENAMDRRR